MSTGTSAAAEAVLADIAEEALEQGPPAQQERAAEHLQNLGAEVEEPPAPDPEDTAVELPAAAPEDWLDIEPEYVEEPEASVEEEDDEEVYVDADEQVRRERAARIKAEKEAAHYKALRAKDSRKLWIAEAKEHAPLATKLYGDDFAGLKADSRKAFLKAAGEAHNTLRSAIEDLVGPERLKASQEAREAAAKQFGKPTTGPGTVPAQKAQGQAELEEMRAKAAPLKNRVRKLWDSGAIEI